MEDFEESGKVTISAEILAGIQEVIPESVSVGDKEIVRAMQVCYNQYKYVICPHTATAFSYFLNAKERSVISISHINWAYNLVPV